MDLNLDFLSFHKAGVVLQVKYIYRRFVLYQEEEEKNITKELTSVNRVNGRCISVNVFNVNVSGNANFDAIVNVNVNVNVNDNDNDNFNVNVNVNINVNVNVKVTVIKVVYLIGLVFLICGLIILIGG